jgi:hypothetical protein
MHIYVAMMDAEDLSDQPQHGGGPAAHIPDPEHRLLAMPPSQTAKKAPASLTVEEKQALADATAATKAAAKEKKRLADAARSRARYIPKIPKDRAPKPKKTKEELRAVQNAGQQARRAAQQHAAGLRAAQELLRLMGGQMDCTG